VALAGADLDRLRASPLYGQLAAENRLPNLNDFFPATGLSSDHDLRQVLLASDGTQVLAIARGNFPTKSPGSVVASRDGRTVTAYLDRATALAGPDPLVRAAIDRYKKGARQPPADLLARAQALPSDVPAWAVLADWPGLRPNTLRHLGNAANLDRILRSVEGATLTADLRSGLHFIALGDCRTEASAQSLSESLRGLAGIARLRIRPNQPDLLRAYDGLQVRQEGRSVRLSLDIPPDLADKLVRGFH
jgi:hypothetical protein